jgi:hypothetical protein
VQRQLEVEAEQADDGDQRHRQQQVGAARGVAQPVDHPGAGAAGLPPQFGRPHHPQRDDCGQIADGVQQHDEPGAEPADEQPAEGGPRDPGDVEVRRAQRRGVRQQVRPDHLPYEGHPGRDLHRVRRPESEGEQVHVPELEVSAEHERGEPGGEHTGHHVGAGQQGALVVAVG